ncbi:MAG: hypothetical protein IJA50_03755 [Firmicutes bacterium]|nr:hypothetical protein [Bacillota bacterium]
MFQINEDKSIYLTRGDACIIKVKAKDKQGNIKTLHEGDVVRITVTDQKSCGNVVLQKDVKVNAEMTEVQIPLTRDETKLGNIISKPKDYWYEIELNPDTAPQTIVGYDEDGAKVLKLFPEGGDVV